MFFFDEELLPEYDVLLFDVLELPDDELFLDTLEDDEDLLLDLESELLYLYAPVVRPYGLCK